MVNLDDVFPLVMRQLSGWSDPLMGSNPEKGLRRLWVKEYAVTLQRTHGHIQSNGRVTAFGRKVELPKPARRALLS